MYAKKWLFLDFSKFGEGEPEAVDASKCNTALKTLDFSSPVMEGSVHVIKYLSRWYSAPGIWAL